MFHCMCLYILGIMGRNGNCKFDKIQSIETCFVSFIANGNLLNLVIFVYYKTKRGPGCG